MFPDFYARGGATISALSLSNTALMKFSQGTNEPHQKFVFKCI